ELVPGMSLAEARRAEDGDAGSDEVERAQAAHVLEEDPGGGQQLGASRAPPDEEAPLGIARAGGSRGRLPRGKGGRRAPPVQSMRPTRIASEPCGSSSRSPSSATIQSPGRTSATPRVKTRSTRAFGGGGVRWVRTSSFTPASCATRAASTGEVW